MYGVDLTPATKVTWVACLSVVIFHFFCLNYFILLHGMRKYSRRAVSKDWSPIYFREFH